jgi:hypothetical protein
VNEWEAIARRGALEAFLEGDEERALDLLAAARAMGEAKESGRDSGAEPAQPL